MKTCISQYDLAALLSSPYDFHPGTELHQHSDNTIPQVVVPNAESFDYHSVSWTYVTAYPTAKNVKSFLAHIKALFTFLVHSLLMDLGMGENLVSLRQNLAARGYSHSGNTAS
jgi:hypothetical protein